MNRHEQRKEIEAAFSEALTRYQEKRSGEFDAGRQREGDVALGKCLQTLSIALRLDIISFAEYQDWMARITTQQPVVEVAP